MINKAQFTKVLWLCDRDLFDAERLLLERAFPGVELETLDTGDAGLSIGSAMTLLHGCSSRWLPVIGARTSIITVLALQGYRFAYLCEGPTPTSETELYYVKEREQTLVPVD